MQLDFSKQKLPVIYKKGNKDCYLDPVREKLIYITPEETVRQQVISYLLYKVNVPKNMIAVEERLSHYGITSKSRADIIVNSYNEKDDATEPIAVIECKAPGVLLGEKTGMQLTHYADELLCNYAIMTDGYEIYCFKFNASTKTYVEIEEIPAYIDMVKGEYRPLKLGKIPDRILYKNLAKEAYKYIGWDIGESTEINKALPMINLLECLLSTENKLPKRRYKIFSLIEDYGVRMLSYGNSSGGIFSGPYRSFLINLNGDTEFVSLGVSTYRTYVREDITKTVMNVAIDNEKNTHHSLQLVIDDNVEIIGNKCCFYHHGRIGVSNIGSGKVNDLREIVQKRYPTIMLDKKFFLGELTHDRLWTLDDKEVIDFIENIISYAIIRDEYRNILKDQKGRGLGLR